jgi:hypothetical protein
MLLQQLTVSSAVSDNLSTSAPISIPRHTVLLSIVLTVSPVEIADQDTPENPPVQCCIQWAAGQTPAAIPIAGACSDNGFTVCVPDGQYGGFQNMTVELAHTYEDDRSVRS